MTAKTSICARYKNVDGWHVFQSDDLPGLYVASMDAKKAFADVGPAIELLIKLDENVDCRAVALVPFNEFLDDVRGDDGSSDDAGASLVLSDKRFAVMGQAA